MLGFLKFLILAPIAAAFVLLGVANRHSVTLVLDPFTQGPGAMSVTLPLFVGFFATIAVGIIIGYIASWFAQGSHRKAERQLKRDCDRLTGECERLKASLPATSVALVGKV